jgi:predicted AlkP superfamily pyrophosphatase or phosphodiesterase
MRSNAAKPLAAALCSLGLVAALTLPLPLASGQVKPVPRPALSKAPGRPKLVVLIVVDQMRGDYVDKFRNQWSRGLKRLLEDGAWFHEAAYPYAATETCVGHSTISTGALPSTHGMIANAWFDRDSQKLVTCTADPKAKNVAYAGGTAKGGDSAANMMVPAFAEELKFQTGGATRVVTFSLKARASITMAGHRADAVAWLESGAWTTSGVYGAMPFVEDYVKAHPVKGDLGKTWALSLPQSAYLYDEKAFGAVGPANWEPGFPHPIRGKSGSGEADEAFYEQWTTSPFADTYLTRLGEAAVDGLGLGKGGATDFLGISYSSVDYVGHAYGPRSWEIQDILNRLDEDLGEFFAHLDKKVGRDNYVVALSADHGVVPVPEDMQKTGTDSGVLRLPELQQSIEKALEPLNYPKPAVARIVGSDVYFAPQVYDRLKTDASAMKAVFDVVLAQPGVAAIYRAEELADRPATDNPTKAAFADGYFAGRSGDLFVVPRPYWLLDSTPSGQARRYGTGHGTPYFYDQRVPILLMGWGIRRGEYFRSVTPADIAPTLATLCGITLAPRDGHVLSEALATTNSEPIPHPASSARPALAPSPNR